MPDSSDYSDESLLTDLPLWADDAARLRLSEVCSVHNIPVDVVTELVALQRERQHQAWKAFHDVSPLWVILTRRATGVSCWPSALPPL